MSNNSKDVCIAIQVLEERIKLLHEQNEIQNLNIEKALVALKQDVIAKLDDHEERLNAQSSAIGFAKGAIAGVITILGILGIKIIGF